MARRAERWHASLGLRVYSFNLANALTLPCCRQNGEPLTDKSLYKVGLGVGPTQSPRMHACMLNCNLPPACLQDVHCLMREMVCFGAPI